MSRAPAAGGTPAASGTPAVEIDRVEAGYGATTVLKGVSLAIRPGEFVAILGSSGCGKTTLLRSIAGFQRISAGAIRLAGRDVAPEPPERRGVAMVFQSYALWPHMTVAGNIGYGLKLRGVRGEAARARIEQVLGMLGLSGLSDRKVTALSGGQRQRVALGRALAIEPSVLLLDEPLSNLDAKVRVQVRQEIKALQHRLGFTAIHVTHDREEAMTMADRIVVMEAGRIAQVGTPEEVYDRPASAFVAGFMGADNTLPLEVRAAGNEVEVAAGAATPVRWRGAGDRPPPDAGAAIAFFRDDAARLAAPGEAGTDAIVLPATVADRAYPGGTYRYQVTAGERRLSVTDARYFEVGQAVGLHLPLARLHVFPNDQGTQREDRP